jgi:hypothetical protein
LEGLSGTIQSIGAQILLVGPFDATPDEPYMLEVCLVPELSKDALVEVRFHIEQACLSVFESDV